MKIHNRKFITVTVQNYRYPFIIITIIYVIRQKTEIECILEKMKRFAFSQEYYNVEVYIILYWVCSHIYFLSQKNARAKGHLPLHRQHLYGELQ